MVPSSPYMRISVLMLADTEHLVERKKSARGAGSRANSCSDQLSRRAALWYGKEFSSEFCCETLHMHTHLQSKWLGMARFVTQVTSWAACLSCQTDSWGAASSLSWSKISKCRQISSSTSRWAHMSAMYEDKSLSLSFFCLSQTFVWILSSSYPVCR